MAPRRASPLDVPSAVSSSDEEEEKSSEEEETSEDEKVQATPKPTVLSPNTKKTDEDSESDAESSSDSEPAESSSGKSTLASPVIRSGEMIRFGMKRLPEEVVKKGLDLLPASKKAELDARWKELHIEELELFAEKNRLRNEQVMLVLEKLKSSDH